jgi:hypothetical protein
MAEGPLAKQGQNHEAVKESGEKGKHTAFDESPTWQYAPQTALNRETPSQTRSHNGRGAIEKGGG